MNRFLTLVLCLGMCGAVHAAAYPTYALEIGINVADQRTVDLADTLATSDPDGTTHVLPIDKDLRLEVRVLSAQGTRNLRIALISSQGGASQTLATLGNIAAPFTKWALAFSVCGDRIIAQPASSTPGRCADLPPMAKPDPTISCNGCVAPYEGMPAAIASHARIAPLSEPGEPLTITGRVFGPDGHVRAGVIVYAYHTDRLGIYPRPDPPRSQASDFNGRLRGWARTDNEGRYTFDTIRPGSYPNSNNPQHVHMHVVEPGCATYVIPELQFTDDPMYQQLSAEERQRSGEYVKAETPQRIGKGWTVTRDIHLGENVAGYKPCKVPE